MEDEFGLLVSGRGRAVFGVVGRSYWAYHIGTQSGRGREGQGTVRLEVVAWAGSGLGLRPVPSSAQQCPAVGDAGVTRPWKGNARRWERLGAGPRGGGSRQRGSEAERQRGREAERQRQEKKDGRRARGCWREPGALGRRGGRGWTQPFFHFCTLTPTSSTPTRTTRIIWVVAGG